MKQTNKPDCPCVKFADDSAIVGLLSDDSSLKAYQDTVGSFSQWCSNKFLELNVSKTKELVFDPRRGVHPIEPVKVNGQSVEVVDSFKYLGVTLNAKLAFQQHTPHTQRKSQQRLYVLRRLKSFHLRPELMLNLYRSIIEPILTYCSVISLSSVSVTEKNKLLKITNTASKMIGLPVPSMSDITDREVLREAHSVSADSSHPLCDEFTLLPSGCHFRTMKCVKNKFNNSFVPSAIHRLNA